MSAPQPAPAPAQEQPASGWIHRIAARLLAIKKMARRPEPVRAHKAPGPRAALALMAVMVLVWGLNWPIMKVALAYIPPLSFALARLLLGAFFLFAILAASRRLALPARGDWPVVLSVGLLQLAAFLVCVNLGLTRVEAGRSAVLSYTTLIWVTPIAVIALGERLTAGKAIGLACGLAGVAVLFNPLDFDWSDGPALVGNGLLLAAALAWAISILHVRRHAFVRSTLQLAPWQMLVGAVPVAILVLLFEDTGAIRPAPTLWLALAYNGPLATAFAFWAWITVNRALPAVTTAMASLAVPVAGTIAAAFALGERITPTGAGGLALIVAGLAVISLETARKAPPPGA